MQIVVDELLTNYQLAGTGRLVVLLHGWGDSSKGLAGLSDALSHNYQVLSIDLPGFGATEAPKTAWNLDGYAQFIASVLQKLMLDQPYAVIGHSNGGAVAIRAISLGALTPQKLVLIAASGIRHGKKTRRIILHAVAKTGSIATCWLPKQRRKALRKKLYTIVGSDLLVVPEMQETFKKTVRQDVLSDSAGIGVQTLLIYAENDAAAPPSYGKKYHAAIKNSQLLLVPDAGHFVHLESPEIVLDALNEFLK